VSTQYFRFSGAQGLEGRRCALLEKLLARADGPVETTDWRADAFRVLAPQPAAMPPVAAAAFCADGLACGAAWVCVATPLHYRAEASNVRLPLEGVLCLDSAAAEVLALDFNRLWKNSGVGLVAGRSGRLYGVFDHAPNVAAHDPEDVRGRHIEEFLPSGPDAGRLRLLMSEMEMWLFEHPVNRERMAQGGEVINGLWLWGGGEPLGSLPVVQGWVAGDDLFFGAIGARCESDSAREGSGVTVVQQDPGSDDWLRAGLPRLKAAAAQLRSGRISRLELSAGARCFSATTRGMRAFWRRRRPWWESFA